MEIKSNSRQIPNDKKYTANKKYSDIMYGYLQANSLRDSSSDIRYLEKKMVNFISIGEDLKISRQTASKRFKALIEQGLIRYDEKRKIYILVKLEAELATLLPCDTVRILCNTLQERALSVLVYCLRTYIQHGESACEINLDVIKNYLGLNISNRGTNNQIVKDILKALNKFNLIGYHTETTKDEKTGGFKTKYILDYVDNDINFD